MNLSDPVQRKRDLVLAAQVREQERKHLNWMARNGYVPAPTQADYERIAGVLLNRGIIERVMR